MNPYFVKGMLEVNGKSYTQFLSLTDCVAIVIITALLFSPVILFKLDLYLGFLFGASVSMIAHHLAAKWVHDKLGGKNG
jgi:hypothetical protein